MPNLKLEILQLENIISNLKQQKTSLNTLKLTMKLTNNNLTGFAWKGEARDAYVELANQWNIGYDEAYNNVETLLSGLSAVLEHAHSLNKKALALPSHVGGWADWFGSNNSVTLDDGLLDAAKSGCQNLFDTFENVGTQVEGLTTLSSSLAYGKQMLSIDGPIAVINAQVSKREEQLSDLREAFEEYRNTSYELDDVAKHAFAGIGFPAGWNAARVKQAEQYGGVWSGNELQALQPEAAAKLLEGFAKTFYTLFPDFSADIGDVKIPIGQNLWVYYNQSFGLSVGAGTLGIDATHLNGKEMLTSLSSHVDINNASVSFGANGGVGFTSTLFSTDGLDGTFKMGFDVFQSRIYAESTIIASLGDGSYSQTLGIAANQNSGRPTAVVTELAKPIENTWRQNAWNWVYDHPLETAGIAIGGAAVIAGVIVLAIVAAPYVLAAAATLGPIIFQIIHQISTMAPRVPAYG